MDPVEKMLIEKYGIDPVDARSMAVDIRHGGERTGNAGDETNRLVKEEAYTGVANDAIAHIDNLRRNALAFKHMHKRMLSGEDLSPGEERWYQQVVDQHRAKIANTAKQRTRQLNVVQADGAHSSRVRGNRMANTVFDSLEDIDQRIGTAQATEQTRRDQIAQQLIPQPQNVMPTVQMPVQQTQQQPMDPNIAALIAQMGGLR